jgi:hypothetical protein
MGRGYWRGDAQARAGWLREMGSIPYRVVRSTFSERSAAPQLQGGRPTFRPLSRRSRARRPFVNIETIRNADLAQRAICPFDGVTPPSPFAGSGPVKTPLLLPPGSVTALKTPLLLPPTSGSVTALKTPLLLPPTSGSGATRSGGAINVSAPSMFTAAVACGWFGGTFTIPTNSYVRGPVFFHSITCASFVTCVRSIFDLELSDARDEPKPSQDEAKSKKESNATMSRRFANMSTSCEREAFR